jgi:hypothetical protein
MATAAPAPVFAIRGFKVTGDNPLGDGETAAVLAPFLRTNATIETLQQATATLEKALRERGYGLHRVALPPQEVGDTVTLNIVRFTVGKVDFQGRSIYDEGNVRRTVPELKEGESPNFKRLAIQTAIANENPNKQVQVGLRESEVPDTIDATITVKEQRPWTFGPEPAPMPAPSRPGATASPSPRPHQPVQPRPPVHRRLHHLVRPAERCEADRPRLQGAAVRAGRRRRGQLHALRRGRQLRHLLQHRRRPHVRRELHDLPGARRRPAQLRDAGPGRQGVRRLAHQRHHRARALDRRSRPVVLGYVARVESDTSFWGYNVDLAVNTRSGAHNDLESYRSEDPRIETTRWAACAAASPTPPRWRRAGCGRRAASSSSARRS